MAGEWREVSVQEIAERTASGPFGSNIKAAEYEEFGVPVIRGINLAGPRFLDSEYVYISEEKAQELHSSLAFPADIVFTARGSIGSVGFVPAGKFDRYLLSPNLVKLTVNRSVADPLYVFYYFRSHFGQHQLLSHASTTGVPNIARALESLRKFRVVLPPLPEQRAIAHILGTLDDKIELNRRMSETLEQMARALFKAWFVDFEPVRAKMNLPSPRGRGAGGEGIYDLFPDRLVESELGEIPEGWEVGTLGEYTENFDSKRVPLSSRERDKLRGTYPYYGAAGVVDYINDYLFDGIYVLVGEDGSVVTETGHAMTQYVWGKFWVNNHAHVLQGKGAVSTEQIYLYFHFESVAPYVTGAVQPKLSQGRMNMMPFVFAGEQVCHAFAALVAPLFAGLRAGTEESRALAALRDALLPKLISGQLRVAEAERFLEEQGL